MLEVCAVLPEWDRTGRDGTGLCAEPGWPQGFQSCDGCFWRCSELLALPFCQALQHWADSPPHLCPDLTVSSFTVRLNPTEVKFIQTKWVQHAPRMEVTEILHGPQIPN